jgi:hypothetical protein
MTDETDLLRRIIEEEVADALRRVQHQDNRPLDPSYIAHRVAEEVLRQLDRVGAQVVRMHANGPRGDD